MKYDYLVVGAGFSGCVFAERIASQLNKTVLVVDTRDHIGGNCYDFYNEHGILVHKYGPHWFHTNDEKTFKYLSRFTKWHLHDHIVQSSIGGKLFPFPINRETINKLYGLKLRTDADVREYYDSVRVKEITAPRNAEEMIISQVGWDLYNKFFLNYTMKQWDMHPQKLDATITARIPVRLNNDGRYFTDKYQGVPESGYTELFKRMLASGNISIQLNTDFKNLGDSITFDKMIYTGSIDYFFDYKYGVLPYRSLRFEHETLDEEYHQSCQQVNYPNDFDFTRIVEWKHATGQKHSKTTITREYPCKGSETNEQLYPIMTPENAAMLKKYRAEAATVSNVKFCGRLAEYKYYNMDQVVARALSIFEKEIKPGTSSKKLVSVGLPANVASNRELFEPHATYTLEDLKVLELHEIFVTYSGLCLDESGLVPESHHDYPDKLQPMLDEAIFYYNKAAADPDSLLELDDDESYLLIHHPWSGNYWHWMTEAILRVWMVRNESENMVLLLPEKLARIDFVVRSLKAFRFRKQLVIPEGKSLLVRTLCMPQIKPVSDSYYADVLAEMRATFIAHARRHLQEDVTLGGRIYISRGKSSRRKVVNEGDVERVLRKYNFTIVNNEEFNFNEQVMLYAHATHVVSVHGAGLTNMLFMKSGGSVLELHKRKTNAGDWHSFAFWYLADALGHMYFQQVCEPSDPAAHFFDADVVVDIGEFERNIRVMINDRSAPY